MPQRRPIGALLALACLAAAAAGQARSAGAEAAPPPDPRAHLPRMVELMCAGIDRIEPSSDALFTEGSTFRGSYDWHSCVHAHWALLCIARVTGDAELESELAERLSPDVLARERAWLAEPLRKRFKVPYGQGWLLLLLAEIERRPERATEELRAFRVEVEERVLGWLEAHPFPEDEETGALNANYSSWLFSFLLAQLSRPVGPGAAERLERLRAERVEPARAAVLAARAGSDYDFLHLPAILALVDRTASPDPAAPSAYPVVPCPALPAEIEFSAVHVLGYELTRAWPWAHDAHAGDETARDAFRRRMADLLGREDCWADDFRVVSHWVPQFLWMGMWLELGRP